MKKLLSILGSLTLTASSGALVVSCSSSDSDKGTIFIDNGGNLKIDSEEILRIYREEVGFGAPIKVVKNFYQLFALAILQEAANNETNLFDNIVESKYSLDNIQEQLSDIYGEKDSTNPTTVWGAANKAFNDFEKEFGDKNNSKRRKKVVNSLKEDYPNVDENYDALKRAYINNYMLNDSNNSAYAKLSNLFISKYQNSFNGTESITSTTITRMIGTFRNYWGNSTIGSISNDIKEYVAEANVEDQKYINILNLINATGGIGTLTTGHNKTVWDITTVQWATTSTEKSIITNTIDDLMNRIINNYTFSGNNENKISESNVVSSGNTGIVNNQWTYINSSSGKELTDSSTFFDLIEQIPSSLDTDNWTVNSSNEEIYGFLSNSQRYVLDKYFESEKPIAYSEVVFSSVGEASLSTAINGTQFFNSASTTDVKQFTGLIDFIENYVSGDISIPGTSQTKWDTIFANQNSTNTGVIFTGTNPTNGNLEEWNTTDSSFYTTNQSSLMTLSDETQSNILKYSVYDFIQSGTSTTYDVTTIDSSYTVLSTGNNFESTLLAEGLSSDNIASIRNVIEKSDDQNDAYQKLAQVLSLIKKLNRQVQADGTNEFSTSDDQSNNKVYQVLNAEQGIIAFVDDDGLHITKINGYDILTDANSVSEQSTVSSENKEDYLAQINTFNRIKNLAGTDNGNYRYILGDANDSFAPTTTRNNLRILDGSDLIDSTTIEGTKNLGLTNSILNKSISNEYERYLVNTSLNQIVTDTKNEAFYSYNIINTIQDYAKNDVDSGAITNGSTWIFNYFVEASGLSPETIIDTLFTFEDNQESKEYRAFLLKGLTGANLAAVINIEESFIEGWDNWNDEIDELKEEDDFGGKNKDLPLSQLRYGTDSNKYSHIDNILSSSYFDAYLKNTSYDFDDEMIYQYLKLMTGGNK